jgi:hypothetical protein
MIQGQPSVGVVGEDEGQIIDCLKHIRCCNCCFDVLWPSPQFLTLFRVVQAPALTKARVGKREMVVAQSARVAELEHANSRLLAGLEQSRLALVKAKTLQNSFSVDYGKLEEEYVGLCATVDTLGQKKAKVVAAYKTEVATIRAKFQEYCVHHRKKLHEFQTNLEGAMNEIGV